MNILKRLKNLWELSRFVITEFDHQLVITEREGQLTYARPQKKGTGQATIVDLSDDVELE